MTYRIQRQSDLHAIVFVLSGELDVDHCAQLGELIACEDSDRVALDLTDLTLADRDGVRFLVGAEAAGIALVNCPDYIRHWIAAEKDS